MTVPPPPPAHAFLAPSASFRWGPGRCPKSAQMEALYPEDEETIEAKEGTAAHFYVSETLNGVPIGVGDIAPNGVTIDADMVDCAQDMLRDIRDTIRDSSSKLAIEARVYATVTIHPQNWGTPDAYILDRVNRRLFIWDYKYGHRYVDAWHNYQTINYAIAIFESEGIPATEWPHWHINTAIAQPRNYHPDGPLREWYFQGAELVTLAYQFREAAALAMDPDAPLRTGDHCRDCQARFACPALETVAMSLVDMSMTAQPVELPPAALGLELRIIREAMKRLGARATGLEEQALAKFRAGQDIPHWRAEYSKGREKWREDTTPDMVRALGVMYGVDALKPPVPLTPVQLRKAGVDTESVTAISHRPTGAMTLVPFNNSDAAKRFT